MQSSESTPLVRIALTVGLRARRQVALADVLSAVAAEGHLDVDSLVLALIGSGNAMGNWGQADASTPLLLPSAFGRLPSGMETGAVSDTDGWFRWSVVVSVSVPRDAVAEGPVLECRLGVWHVGHQCIVGIDNAKTDPTRVALRPDANEPAGESFSGDVDFCLSPEVAGGEGGDSYKWQSDVLRRRDAPLPQCHIISSSAFRAISGASKGPYLHLTLYPHRNDLPFDAEQWLQSLPDSEREAFRARSHTCRLRLTRATMIESSFTNWSAFDGSSARARMGLAPLLSPAPPESLLGHVRGCAVPEPLRAVEPVREADARGINNAATMVSWTVTYDLSLLTNHIPVIEFEGYSASAASPGGGEAKAHKGSFCLLPDMFMLRDQTNGASGVAAVSDDKQFVAPIYMNYAVVRPFVHHHNSLRAIRSVESFRKLHFKTMMGHRGLGKTYTNSVTTSKSIVQKFSENSIPSFVAAHKRGAGGVEFDVMLTADRVPVVCHEPVFTVETAVAGGHRMGQAEVYVHQITKRQLDALVKEAVPAEADSQCRLKTMLEHHWRSILEISRGTAGASVSTSASAAAEAFLGDASRDAKMKKLISFGTTPTTARRECRRLNLIDQSPFISLTPSHREKHIPLVVPTLAEVMANTPPSLSYNLEVKFPFQPKADRNLHLQSDNFEINRYCDLILAVVFEFSNQGREIGFSSFDPDICTALMLKQNRYHVLFLADCADRADQKDYRSWGLEAPIQYAMGERLAGVSIPSRSLLRPSDVETVVRNRVVMPRYSSHSQAAQRAACDDPSLATVDSTFAAGVVGACAARGLHVWTWGGANDNLEWCEMQKTVAGVSGIITDNIPPPTTEHET